eukprot:TRINITY_DN10943_c2_g1_i3.p1 TRINITY_DN10943_c2_g1~~TRINITY_DN10943_c2_g1_i3.p1  ORF type:complete len:717 (-),score=133.56 TRINITY_DN10943_c2_g1_i3:245-2395(-)
MQKEMERLRDESEKAICKIETHLTALQAENDRLRESSLRDRSAAENGLREETSEVSCGDDAKDGVMSKLTDEIKELKAENDRLRESSLPDRSASENGLQEDDIISKLRGELKELKAAKEQLGQSDLVTEPQCINQSRLSATTTATSPFSSREQHFSDFEDNEASSRLAFSPGEESASDELQQFQLQQQLDEQLYQQYQQHQYKDHQQYHQQHQHHRQQDYYKHHQYQQRQRNSINLRDLKVLPEQQQQQYQQHQGEELHTIYSRQGSAISTASAISTTSGRREYHQPHHQQTQHQHQQYQHQQQQRNSAHLQELKVQQERQDYQQLVRELKLQRRHEKHEHHQRKHQQPHHQQQHQQQQYQQPHHQQQQQRQRQRTDSDLLRELKSDLDMQILACCANMGAAAAKAAFSSFAPRERSKSNQGSLTTRQLGIRSQFESMASAAISVSTALLAQHVRAAALFQDTVICQEEPALKAKAMDVAFVVFDCVQDFLRNARYDLPNQEELLRKALSAAAFLGGQLLEYPRFENEAFASDVHEFNLVQQRMALRILEVMHACLNIALVDLPSVKRQSIAEHLETMETSHLDGCLYAMAVADALATAIYRYDRTKLRGLQVEDEHQGAAVIEMCRRLHQLSEKSVRMMLARLCEPGLLSKSSKLPEFLVHECLLQAEGIAEYAEMQAESGQVALISIPKRTVAALRSYAYQLQLPRANTFSPIR